MDPETLQRYLREAHAHVTRDRERIRRQRQIVLEFRVAGNRIKDAFSHTIINRGFGDMKDHPDLMLF